MIIPHFIGEGAKTKGSVAAGPRGMDWVRPSASELGSVLLHAP